MIDFIVGYVLGTTTGEKTGVSRRAIGIAILILFASAGAGWLFIAATHPATEVDRCGGPPMAAMMCSLQASAGTFGLLILGSVALVAVVWIALAKLAKK